MGWEKEKRKKAVPSISVATDTRTYCSDELICRTIYNECMICWPVYLVHTYADFHFYSSCLKLCEVRQISVTPI